MTKSKQQDNYLEVILEASKTAKSKSELSRISGISVFLINKSLDKNPAKKLIVLETLNSNKKNQKRSLTSEQKKIYDMFMKMALEKKDKTCTKENTIRINNIEYEHADAKKAVFNRTPYLISLPIKKCVEENAVSLRLKNNSYNKNILVTDTGKERFNRIYQSVLLHIGDNIYSIRFFFNNNRSNCLAFRHLKVINFQKENNTEVIYSKTIYSEEQLSNISYRYQSFVKKFIDNNLLTF